MNRRIISAGLAVCVLAAGLSACDKKTEQQAGGEMVVNVVAFKARQQPIEEKINLVGTLEANEQVEIQSEIDGIVEEIKFEEGQPVEKGEILFLIDQKKLTAALQRAQADYQLAQATAKRYEELVKSLAVSKQEYDQTVATLESTRAAVELAQEQLEDATIRAAFAGTMGERFVSRGQFVSKGARLAFLVDDDPVKASFYVPERFLGQISIDQKVEMTVAAYPDKIFTGIVRFIDPKVNPDSRSALVKAYVDNPESRLRPGMFANLNLITSLRQQAVVIPETALMINLSRTTVNVVNKDQVIETRDVKPGVRFDGMVEIAEGVQPGDVVVIEGTQKVRAGSKVDARLSDQSPESKTK